MQNYKIIRKILFPFKYNCKTVKSELVKWFRKQEIIYNKSDKQAGNEDAQIEGRLDRDLKKLTNLKIYISALLFLNPTFRKL